MILRRLWPLTFLKKRAVAGGGGSAPYGTHAYWRFQVDAMNTDTYVGWVAIRFYDASNNLITTTGQTYSEGGAGSQGAHGASAPFDGNSGTYWLRSGAPSYVQIQFASAVAPARWEFDCEQVARSAINFTIKSSDNGSSFTDALVVYEPSHDVPGSTRSWPQSFTGGKYKAYRLNVTASNDASFTLIQEMEMCATVGGADQCSGGRAFGSQNNVNEEPAKAFDNTDGNNYDLHIPVTGYLAYGFPVALAIAQYKVRCNNTNSRTPKDWTFQGTTDGVTWTTLNTQTNQTWSVPETKSYTI